MEEREERKGNVVEGGREGRGMKRNYSGGRKWRKMSMVEGGREGRE